MNLREKLIDLSNQRTAALDAANTAMEAGNTADYDSNISYASILLWFAIVTATLESGIRKVRRRQTRPQLRS